MKTGHLAVAQLWLTMYERVGAFLLWLWLPRDTWVKSAPFMLWTRLGGEFAMFYEHNFILVGLIVCKVCFSPRDHFTFYLGFFASYKTHLNTDWPQVDGNLYFEDFKRVSKQTRKQNKQLPIHIHMHKYTMHPNLYQFIYEIAKKWNRMQIMQKHLWTSMVYVAASWRWCGRCCWVCRLWMFSGDGGSVSQSRW